MIKRIGYSFIYSIPCAVICVILGKIKGSANYLDTAIVCAISAFAGTFVGYGYGKNDRD